MQFRKQLELKLQVSSGKWCELINLLANMPCRVYYVCTYAHYMGWKARTIDSSSIFFELSETVRNDFKALLTSSSSKVEGCIKMAKQIKQKYDRKGSAVPWKPVSSIAVIPIMFNSHWVFRRSCEKGHVHDEFEHFEQIVKDMCWHRLATPSPLAFHEPGAEILFGFPLSCPEGDVQWANRRCQKSTFLNTV